jgi:hypothetical protein
MIRSLSRSRRILSAACLVAVLSVGSGTGPGGRATRKQKPEDWSLLHLFLVESMQNKLRVTVSCRSIRELRPLKCRHRGHEVPRADIGVSISVASSKLVERLRLQAEALNVPCTSTTVKCIASFLRLY